MLSIKDQLADLQDPNQKFDLIIIGGGASGAGCALDAALRGLKVALIEKNDWAGSTSGRSTKLIHGGVRYLEKAITHLDFGQLKQVYHGLRERRVMLQNAPYLAHPIALITPVNGWFQAFYMGIGLQLYSLIAGQRDTLPKASFLNQKKSLARIPTLAKNTFGAVEYYDGSMDDARFCLALVKSAAKAGAKVINHTKVVDLIFDPKTNKISGVGLYHAPSGQSWEIDASLVLNCTGPLADDIRQMANPALESRIVPSKGVHIVLPKAVLPTKTGMLIPKTKDGRVIFALPFGDFTLVGTTDTPYPHVHEHPELMQNEVNFLLETLQPYLEKPISSKDVLGGFAALRPLVTDDAANKSTASMLRDHTVEVDKESGLISLMGGKWTTYRVMAKDAIDTVCKHLGNQTPCSTEHHKLVGSDNYSSDLLQKWVSMYQIASEIIENLLQRHGSEAEKILQQMAAEPTVAQRILPNLPFTWAELDYIIENEQVATVHDVLAQRLRIDLQDWQCSAQLAPIVAEKLGSFLQWSLEQQQEASKTYLETIHNRRCLLGITN